MGDDAGAIAQSAPLDAEEDCLIVKVVIANDVARVLTEDRKIDMQVSAEIVRKRMGSARTVFFNAEMKHGLLEIGERADWQTW